MKDSEPETTCEGPIGRAHLIVQKDYYRLMKAEKHVENDIRLKQKQCIGGNFPVPLIKPETERRKDLHSLVLNKEVPADFLYAIEKVVRMRTNQGRFGLDHSETVNYEIEKISRRKDNHMNWLAYKEKA